MPELNGVETTAEIRKLSEEARIIIFTMYSDREYVISLFRMGISGYILKEEALSDLREDMDAFIQKDWEMNGLKRTIHEKLSTEANYA